MLVKQIPRGKVSTYGEIARVLGTKSSSRLVGYALSVAKTDSIPCHRVVNRFGALTGKHHFVTPDIMQKLLEREKVTFDGNGNVLMQKHFFAFKV